MNRNLVAITGASSGIGEAFARRLAPDHDLLLVARREDRLQALRRELTDLHGNQVDTVAADLTSEVDLDLVAKRLEEDRRLVLLVNNAGFGTSGLFWQTPYDGQQKMHQLHVLATLRLTHSALRNLVEQDRGGIINVASVSAFVRAPGAVSYAATKSWMTAFTEGLHLELQASGSSVVVQALCPGLTRSEFHESMGLAGGQYPGGPSFWNTADYVVNASLEGLRRRKVFVIPNWRYRLITTLFSKLPSSLRIGLESRTGALRRSQITGRSGDKGDQSKARLPG